MLSFATPYQRDLQLVPNRLREPLENFIARGTLPVDHPELMAALSGDLFSAFAIYNLTTKGRGKPFNGVAVFIDEHVPDIACGDMAYVVRWHRWGGWQGRPRQ